MDWQGTVPIGELWIKPQVCSNRVPLFHCIPPLPAWGTVHWKIYMVLWAPDCSQDTNQLNQKFLNWGAVQTHSRRKKRISDKHFKTSSCDAISRKETYHFIFQTTYPTAPTVMSKNFWMLSSFEEQDASFGNRRAVTAWMWWLSRSRAILGRWQNAHLLPFRGQPLDLAFPKATFTADFPESSCDVLQKTRLQDLPTSLVQGRPLPPTLLPALGVSPCPARGTRAQGLLLLPAGWRGLSLWVDSALSIKKLRRHQPWPSTLKRNISHESVEKNEPLRIRCIASFQKMLTLNLHAHPKSPKHRYFSVPHPAWWRIQGSSSRNTENIFWKAERTREIDWGVTSL